MSRPSADLVRKTLHYNPESGVFRRRQTGHVTGTHPTPHGYGQIKVGDRQHLAHRLAWVYMTGEWPTAGIDHRNGNKLDNRFANLREATTAQNVQNVHTVRSDNKSGFTGVSLHKPGVWRAVIKTGGKRRHLGLFADPAVAADAYHAAKRLLHPFWIEEPT